MYKSSCLMLLGLLAATTFAAPCIVPAAADQLVFPTALDRQVSMTRVGFKAQGTSDLNAKMQQIIDNEMTISLDMFKYMDALIPQLCKDGCVSYELNVLSMPYVELIPARRLSQTIDCTSASCQIGYHDQSTVSTTHSATVGLSAEVDSAPFGMGVKFTASASYEFSHTNEESTTFDYEFNVEKGDVGYIAIANAQISAKVRFRKWNYHCIPPWDSVTTVRKIGNRNHSYHGASEECGAPTSDETGYHEAVIMENNKPRSVVAFIYTGL